VEFTFCDGALSEEAGCDAPIASHLVGQSKANRYWETATDDRVAAEEAVLRVKKVHRPTASMAAAVRLSEHLGHETASRKAARERMTMLTVGRDHVVVFLQRLQCRRADRLLADIEMEEPPNLAGLVKLCSLLLEASYQ
jgi:hypothetical protein